MARPAGGIAPEPRCASCGRRVTSGARRGNDQHSQAGMPGSGRAARGLATYSKELRTMGAYPARRRRRNRGAYLAACGAVAIAVTAAACSSSNNGTTGGAATPTGGTPVSGGTATYALPPSTTPNYIFPFTSSAYFSVVNA